MDAIELLELQHREVEDLFEECGALVGEPDQERRQTLFEKLADTIAGHTTIEEQLFYPAVQSMNKNLVRQGLEDHLAIKRVLVELLGIETDDAAFSAKLEVLRVLVEHHVAEEEGKLFPAVERGLSMRRRNELGDEMESMFESMREDEPRRYIPEQIEEARH